MTAIGSDLPACCCTLASLHVKMIPDHKFVIKTYLTLMKGLKVSSWPMVDGMVGRSFSLLAYTPERKKKKN